MPTSRTPNRKANVQKPRRTHNLGGCATCRRRHVKCDQVRPKCGVCGNANLECGGWPDQIRWASLTTGPTSRKSKYSFRAEQPVGATLIADSQALVSHGVSRTRNLQRSPIHPEPEAPATETFEDPLPLGEDFSTDPDDLPHEKSGLQHASTLPVGQLLDWGWLFDGTSGLGWNDIFDNTMPLYTNEMPSLLEENLEFAPPISVQHQQWPMPMPLGLHTASSVQDDINQNHVVDITAAVTAPDSTTTTHAQFSGIIDEQAVLEHGKTLLRHFRELVIPKFSPVPMACKSPWEIMNWRAAVQTHADMTYLQSDRITHASRANLFAVLACSAYSMVNERQPNSSISTQLATQITEYAYTQAKTHMQDSLKLEVSGIDKAKYKDQLMAIISLIAITTHMGLAGSARYYLIDAERLVRLRGLAKREVSRHVRLLHHVYTWLRIIGESTYVLHDHTSNVFQTRIESMLNSVETIPSGSPISDRSRPVTREFSELDDFLRVDAHGVESESEGDAGKDQETGIRDIHLSDQRQWSDTMYMDIYGIPEVWLSLVSQITRIANITDYLDSRSGQAPQAFTSSLDRKLSRLESRVCSFAAKYSNVANLATSRNNGDTPLVSGHQAMLRAMASAVVILFYRRLRKVNPWILQAHVNDVISALEDFGQANASHEAGTGTVGSPWPAFIAGCEAMAPDSRQWLSDWVENAAARGTSSGVLESLQIMSKVWECRDAADKPSKDARTRSSGKGNQITWIDISRQDRLWLMLY